MVDPYFIIDETTVIITCNETHTIHPSSGTFASYVARTCDQNLKSEFEKHCLECEGCQAQLIILLRLCFEEPTVEEQEAVEAQREALQEAVLRFLHLYRRLSAWRSALQTALAAGKH